MTGVAGQGTMPAPCPKCTGRGDAHYLTCPTLRYHPARIEPNPDQPGYNRGVWVPSPQDIREWQP